jgi:hypothetical protein
MSALPPKAEIRRRYVHGESLFALEGVVGLGGPELRANHAVAIEPISDPYQIGCT